MNKVTYQIVEHDGGWAYKLDGTYSETFASHADALAAAKIAAAEQQVSRPLARAAASASASAAGRE